MSVLDRLDHVADAERHIDWIHDWQSNEGDTEATNLASVGVAQVLATLALVEQKRLANVIAALAAGFFLGYDNEDEAWDAEVAPFLVRAVTS